MRSASLDDPGERKRPFGGRCQKQLGGHRGGAWSHNPAIRRASGGSKAASSDPTTQGPTGGRAARTELRVFKKAALKCGSHGISCTETTNYSKRLDYR